ncbi:hypothetical protein M0R19_03615 [Candidatus Pacearchaeota archaeon]|jgi:hypothetical protein|nr:hypothetical protein [Candidatus Pacearchaeota archaeon]
MKAYSIKTYCHTKYPFSPKEKVKKEIRNILQEKEEVVSSKKGKITKKQRWIKKSFQILKRRGYNINMSLHLWTKDEFVKMISSKKHSDYLDLLILWWDYIKYQKLHCFSY